MSRNASVNLAWADGEYAFRLGIGELEELQEKCDRGPFEIMQRLAAGTWRVAEIRETLRLGLIGGGMPPMEALKLIKRYVDDRPLAHNIQHASAVILAAVLGAPDGEKPGKARAAKIKVPSSQTESSPLPPTMAPDQP